MPNAVVLLSGGLDSATTLAIAKSKGFNVSALSFSYGQRHAAELDAAIQIARQFRIDDHAVIDIDLRAFGKSSLTDDISVPKGRTLDEMCATIPSTYVPARNTIFLSFALAFAEVRDACDIFIGVNALDYSGYPDCRPEYISAYQAMANLATAQSVSGNSTLEIHTPLINKTKAEIIQLGTDLGADYAATVSCYEATSEGLACGQCDSCILRRTGFDECGIADPTRYADPEAVNA